MNNLQQNAKSTMSTSVSVNPATQHGLIASYSQFSKHLQSSMFDKKLLFGIYKSLENSKA